MRSNEIWNENKHKDIDNNPLNYNISSNNKYTSIVKRKGFNKEGKSKTQLLKERKFIGKYWLINFKYKGRSKSIHIGENKNVIKFIRENDVLNSSFKIPKKIGEDNIRRYISFLIEDNLYDLVKDDIMGKHNIFLKKITFEDLVESSQFISLQKTFWQQLKNNSMSYRCWVFLYTLILFLQGYLLLVRIESC